jgi:DNA-binding GntR family transcriptional regulator
MVSLKRAPSLSLVQVAYNSIVAAIFDQQLKPSNTLNIDELARQLDMSNTPIREALALAKSEGLVKQVSNKGYSVAELLSEEEYECLFDARILIEEYAVKNIQKVDLNALQQIIAQMNTEEHGTAYNLFQNVYQYDRQFHIILVDAIGNPFISRSWRDLHCHLHQNRLRIYDTSGIFDKNYAIEEHTEVLNHLISDNMTAAANAIVKHLRNTQNRILPLLKTQQSENATKDNR